MSETIGSREACLRLGNINRTTLFRWAKEGLIKPITKLPGKNGAALWDAGAVDELAAAIKAREEAAA